MTKHLHTLKKKVYYSATMLFPSFYKKRFFAPIHHALEHSNTGVGLPEKELLVLYYLLDKDGIAVDIGANNGVYSYFFKEIKKSRRVLAFEPLPNLFKKLQAWFKNIELFNLALSNKQEKAKIHIPLINEQLYESRAKLDDLKEENETGFKEIAIDVNTLDNMYATLKPGGLNIIKIDIEGHELKAIEGAANTIKAFNPYLLVEIEGRHHNQSVNEPVAYICGLGYSAWFFNFKNKQLEAFSGFNAVTMQQAKEQNTFNYTNNFLFIPSGKTADVNRVNQQLAAYFNLAV